MEIKQFIGFVIATTVACVLIAGCEKDNELGEVHPNIKQYNIVTIDTVAIQKKIDAAEPFSLKLGEETIEVTVKHSSVYDENAKIVIREKNKYIPKTIDSRITYAGNVVGNKDTSRVRLTIKGSFMQGFVFINNEWWFIEPLKKFRPQANENEFITYRTVDVMIEREFGKDTVPVGPETPLPENHPPVSNKMKSETTGAAVTPFMATSNGLTIVNLAPIADREFKVLIDSMDWVDIEWYEYQASVINMMNGIFENLDVYFNVTWQFLDSNNATLQSTNEVTLLNQTIVFIHDYYGGDLSSLATRRRWQTDIAHLTTGKNIDGNVIGYAQAQGWYGLSQQRFAIAGTILYPLLYENLLTTTHEIGHNVNGVHSEADEWCNHRFLICLNYVRTIMWETLYGDNVDRFSDGSRNQNHNNKQRIINNIASRTPQPCVICHGN